MRVDCVTMSRRDDRDRSRTRRRRDRSTSPQARKAHRREHNDHHVSEGMDWNNLVSWQHNSGYNSASNFPMMPTNFQSTHSPTQQFQHPAINYMMPIPPDPTPTKFIPPVMPPPVTTPQPTPPPGPPAALPVRPQKAWLTPSPDWTPGDGMFDVNQLYNFSLPMTVANTPHGNLRDMSGMDIRDVRLVQVIHGGLTNWLLRPFARGRFVTWEGFRTRTRPYFGVPVPNYYDDHSRSTCSPWKRTLPTRWVSTSMTSISRSRFMSIWPAWYFNFFSNTTLLSHLPPRQMTWSRSTMI